MTDAETPSKRGGAKTLAIGFGTAVAMWALAYVSLMQPGLVVGELLFAVTLACVFAGGAIAGRWRADHESAVMSGAKVGLLAAVLNLLVVGALLVDPQTGQLQPTALWWILGNFGMSVFLAGIGGLAGGVWANQSSAISHGGTPNWFYCFSVVAAVTVFLLLITGGLVTGLKAGLAVPDWPTSFGHNMLLYPLAEMSGGKFFEHAHRLYGMLVGVTAIALVLATFKFDRRSWMRGVAIAYLVMVCVQGYMGGRRVTEISTTLAIVHGMFGQIVFATITCIAAFASTTWRRVSTLPPLPSPRSALPKWALLLTVMLIVQLGLGAMYRHVQRAMADPPEPLHVLFTHIFVALLVTVLVIFVAGRAWGTYRDRPVLPGLGLAMLLLVGLQLALGGAATIVVWMSDPHHATPPAIEVVVTTAHQINGAMLLALSALLTLWSRRLLSHEPLREPVTALSS